LKPPRIPLHCWDISNSTTFVLAAEFLLSLLTAETICWTKKLNKEDYGIDKHWVLLAVVEKPQTLVVLTWPI